jgi:Prokaryotic Cytochrome C oxidase subunit IV
MKSLRNPPAVVWSILCGLTVLSVALVEGAHGRALASIAVLLIAAAKSRLVILHYMEAPSRHPALALPVRDLDLCGYRDDCHRLSDASVTRMPFPLKGFRSVKTMKWAAPTNVQKRVHFFARLRPDGSS